MKKLLLIALGVIATVAGASAQDRPRLLDSIMIHSDAPYSVDRPLYRVFGFGGEYTDTIDWRLPNGVREREIPGAPPASLYVMYDAQHVTEPAWIDRDVRGIPDSVASGSARKFSLRYYLEIQRGVGQVITLVMPHALPAGIDSINFRDIIGGTGGILFNETITAGPDSVKITNEGLTRIAMIVYYDGSLVPTGVAEPLAARPAAGLRLVPNPAIDRVTIDATLPAGSRVVVSDLRGATVIDDRADGPSTHRSLAVDGLAAGLYMVRAVGPEGAVIAHSRLIVRQ